MKSHLQQGWSSYLQNTDGSKDPESGKVAFGVIKNSKQTYQMSVFTAEMLTILMWALVDKEQ